MQVLPTELEGLRLIAPAIHGDARGFFLESFRANTWSEAGVTTDFVQDNHSRSKQGVVRGMHFSLGEGQAKLIRCVRGHIWDVVVDIRPGSETFGQWEGFDLTDENAHQLFIPVGFAHGFCVTSDIADVVYKCSSYYSPETERGFQWNDPDIDIPWPQTFALLVSDRDQEADSLSEIRSIIPDDYGS